MLGSLAFLALVTVVSVAAPLIAPSDPTYINPVDRLLGPSLKYPLGTDDLGRNQLSRLIYGGRVSLLIGVTVTVASAVLGSALGLIAGFYPRLD
ncbi:MAG TPA: ABC transporter permease, partial [Thermomicrobiales bacterium]|nr:ABC transporter permease [Thermomicrobiales bacterium]